MKKKISIIILIIILFSNLISSISLAITADEITEVDPSEKSMFDKDELFKELDDGKTKLTNSEGNSKVVETKPKFDAAGSTGSIVLNGINAIPKVINYILRSTIETVEGRDDIEVFTIYDVVMGNYSIFNFDYISSTSGQNTLADNIKTHIKKMYNFTRNISIAASLFVLIYIGIRMAISTVAAKKAKYKSMLTSWVISLCLVFLMHFIIVGLSYISITALNLVKQFADNIRVGGAASTHVGEIEVGIINGIYADLSGKSGHNVIVSLLTVGYLLFIQCKFFVMYTRRFCEITLLTIIGPLVTVTYSIDKAGDNKAQAFQAWITELIIKVSIQIVHALVYILFIVSASAIAQKAPIVALIFFSGLSRGEKVFRNLLNVRDKGLEDVKLPVLE